MTHDTRREAAAIRTAGELSDMGGRDAMSGTGEKGALQPDRAWPVNWINESDIHLMIEANGDPHEMCAALVRERSGSVIPKPLTDYWRRRIDESCSLVLWACRIIVREYDHLLPSHSGSRDGSDG